METLLHVDGAELYYRTTGSGPVLLISQSGEGDADRTVDLVASLAERFTVVTYDRRGLSRSRVTDPSAVLSVRQHADDAAAILARVTDEPAVVLGLSLGGVIGLHLLAAHPGLVAKLVVHEPIALSFLAPADADAARATLHDVRRVHERDGWRPAAAAVASALGIDPRAQETEPGVTRFPFDDRRVANFDFFLRADLRAVLADDLTLADVPRTAAIVPAVGEASPPDGFDYLAALALAEHLGTPVQRFPGGHNGNLTHPRAFAERFLSV